MAGIFISFSDEPLSCLATENREQMSIDAIEGKTQWTQKTFKFQD